MLSDSDIGNSSNDDISILSDDDIDILSDFIGAQPQSDIANLLTKLENARDPNELGTVAKSLNSREKTNEADQSNQPNHLLEVNHQIISSIQNISGKCSGEGNANKPDTLHDRNQNENCEMIGPLYSDDNTSNIEDSDISHAKPRPAVTPEMKRYKRYIYYLKNVWQLNQHDQNSLSPAQIKCRRRFCNFILTHEKKYKVDLKDISITTKVGDNSPERVSREEIDVGHSSILAKNRKQKKKRNAQHPVCKSTFSGETHISNNTQLDGKAAASLKNLVRTKEHDSLNKFEKSTSKTTHLDTCEFSPNNNTSDQKDTLRNLNSSVEINESSYCNKSSPMSKLNIVRNQKKSSDMLTTEIRNSHNTENHSDARNITSKVYKCCLYNLRKLYEKYPGTLPSSKTSWRDRQIRNINAYEARMKAIGLPVQPANVGPPTPEQILFKRYINNLEIIWKMNQLDPSTLGYYQIQRRHKLSDFIQEYERLNTDKVVAEISISVTPGNSNNADDLKHIKVSRKEIMLDESTIQTMRKNKNNKKHTLTSSQDQIAPKTQEIVLKLQNSSHRTDIDCSFFFDINGDTIVSDKDEMELSPVTPSTEDVHNTSSLAATTQSEDSHHLQDIEKQTALEINLKNCKPSRKARHRKRNKGNNNNKRKSHEDEDQSEAEPQEIDIHLQNQTSDRKDVSSTVIINYTSAKDAGGGEVVLHSVTGGPSNDGDSVQISNNVEHDDVVSMSASASAQASKHNAINNSEPDGCQRPTNSGNVEPLKPEQKLFNRYIYCLETVWTLNQLGVSTLDKYQLLRRRRFSDFILDYEKHNRDIRCQDIEISVPAATLGNSKQINVKRVNRRQIKIRRSKRGKRNRKRKQHECTSIPEGDQSEAETQEIVEQLQNASDRKNVGFTVTNGGTGVVIATDTEARMESIGLSSNQGVSKQMPNKAQSKDNSQVSAQLSKHYVKTISGPDSCPLITTTESQSIPKEDETDQNGTESNLNKSTEGEVDSNSGMSSKVELDLNKSMTQTESPDIKAASNKQAAKKEENISNDAKNVNVKKHLPYTEEEWLFRKYKNHRRLVWKLIERDVTKLTTSEVRRARKVIIFVQDYERLHKDKLHSPLPITEIMENELFADRLIYRNNLDNQNTDGKSDKDDDYQDTMIVDDINSGSEEKHMISENKQNTDTTKLLNTSTFTPQPNRDTCLTPSTSVSSILEEDIGMSPPIADSSCEEIVKTLPDNEQMNRAATNSSISNLKSLTDSKPMLQGNKRLNTTPIISETATCMPKLVKLMNTPSTLISDSEYPKDNTKTSNN